MIVGISGFARAGKDTAAEALVSKRGFTRVAFADPLKKDVRDMVSKALHQVVCGDSFLLQMQDFDRKKELYRPLLVEYGRAMRNLQPGYWISRAALEAEKHPRVVITDVRYADEAEWIRGTGGIVIEITRPGVGPANAEESESFSKFLPDISIGNIHGIGGLHEAVLAVVDNWMKGQETV